MKVISVFPKVIDDIYNLPFFTLLIVSICMQLGSPNLRLQHIIIKNNSHIFEDMGVILFIINQIVINLKNFYLQ